MENLLFLKEKNVPGCDTGALGWAVGHLYDHGLTRDEIELLVKSILDGVEKMKADPQMHEASRVMQESASRVMQESALRAAQS